MKNRIKDSRILGSRYWVAFISLAILIIGCSDGSDRSPPDGESSVVLVRGAPMVGGLPLQAWESPRFMFGTQLQASGFLP
jgi:hypothetical protein